MKTEEANPAMRSQRWPMRLGQMVAATEVLLCFAGCRQKPHATSPPPPTVEVTTVIQAEVPIYHEWIGVLDGYEAELRYRQNILNAFREVSDALISRLRLAEMREHQQREVTALETAVKLSRERYVAGKADYYEVLEAQQQLFPSQLNLARTQRDQLLAVVFLYKALGGGWQDELNTNQRD